MVRVIGIIPARFDSVRFPGKLLADLNGQSVLERTWSRTCLAERLDQVVIASGDEKITRAALEFGAEVVEVYDNYPSGSDRIAAALNKLFPAGSRPDIVVNIQGDEPLISPSTIDSVVNSLLNDRDAGVATAAVRIESRDSMFDPSVVKVVTDNSGRALYFSRAAIPHNRDGREFSGLQHVGIYAYRIKALESFVKGSPCWLEQSEKLEQLRLLFNGIKIAVVEVLENGIGVDTSEDLEKVRQLLDDE